MWEIFRFECRYQLRSPLFIVIAAAFFLIGFLVMASENVSVGGIGDNLNLNAAFAIIQIQYVLSIIGMFAAVAFVAGAIVRDQEARTAELLFSTGLTERDYLLGRFCGASLFATLAVMAGLLGTLTGSFMPWLDQARVGAFDGAPYLFAALVVVLPNLLVICALFFAVAALTRSLPASYMAALGFMVTYVVAAAITDQERIRLLALADPFGATAFGEQTRYWTVFERNASVPELTGLLLYNRLIWASVALLVLAVTLMSFRFSLAGPPTLAGRWWRRRASAAPVPRPAVQTPRLHTDLAAGLAALRSQLRMDVRGVLRSVPFYVVLAFGMFNVIGGFVFAISDFFGTPVLPVTAMLIRIAEGSFLFVVLIVVIYYAGELTHRERQSGVADIIDATPYPNVIMVLSKIGALWFVVAALLLILIVTSMAVQVFNDFYEFELGLYFRALYLVSGFFFFLLCVPAVLIQVLSPNKFLGMLALLLLVLGLQVASNLGFEHHLYLLGPPEAPYSPMNGYGHFVVPLFWFSVYWALFAALLVIVAHLLFPRGQRGTWRGRLAQARARWTPAVAAGAALLLLAFGGVGGFIFYNTNVLNDYLTSHDREAMQAEYEKRFGEFGERPMPQIVDLDVAIDIFPDQRRLEAAGTARLINAGSDDIDTALITLSPLLDVDRLELSGATELDADGRLGVRRFRFDPPLASGTEQTLRWNLSWRNPGFENDGSSTRLVHNGTFVNNTEVLPMLGFDTSRRLTEPHKRRRYGLPPIERLPRLGDPAWLDRNQFTVSRRTDFRAVVSTVPDQIAVAPGYLQREWTENGRRYFDYRMDAPIWPFVSFMSARYAVARDVWNDVALEVYYHPPHHYNVDAMLHASKRSLDYFTREFSPYQYRQFRILEFPGYEIFAQAFPNTIPFSEAIGFVADLRDPKHIDYVFYVTAHELAHQWWGHQVVGANMQGATLIVETLAQYSALMVQQREFGPHHMRRFLKYELDNYLRSRGGELLEELPLVEVEEQGYIHYRKGSVVMFALQDALGEDKVNAALRSFLGRFAFQGPPFPTSRDLVAEFRAVAAPEHQALITDLFEKIVLFDLRVTDAAVVRAGDAWEVTMTVQARKFEADGEGREREVPLDQHLDIGVFPRPDDTLGDADLPEPLWLERRRVVSGAQTFTIQVPAQPHRVGIDPYVKMIDRNPDDNLRRL